MDHQHRPSSKSRRAAGSAAISVAVIASIAVAGTTSAATAPPTTEPAEETPETLLPLAPESQRVDLEQPTFSNPTTIDNPLYPVSLVASVVMLGNDEGRLDKAEKVVLPQPIVVDVNGQPVEALVVQIFDYQEGRIAEVTMHSYAQADDGSVWWLREDSFTYEDGVVADTDETWLSGLDGPPTMVMPATPQGGEVFRPEDRPDAFEEYTVTDVGVTVDGPTGPVDDAIIVEENHTLEGVYEDKSFAPRYGEFASGVGDSLDRVAIAVPTDAIDEPVPAELTTLFDGALTIVDAAAADDWETVATTQTSMIEAWETYEASYDVPPRLGEQMGRTLRALAGDSLVPAADDHNTEGTANAALDVAQASLDLQLQFRPPTEIDRERFELWSRQLVVDANRLETDPAFVAGDVATLEWILERFAHTLDPATLAEVESLLADLRVTADDEDVAAAAELASQLVATIDALA